MLGACRDCSCAGRRARLHGGSVENLNGTFTYAVRIEAGSVGCGLARAVLRDAADWPPGRERGVGITLLTHGLTRRELLVIADSMAAVPA
jgi:hypothetical protein